MVIDMKVRGCSDHDIVESKRSRAKSRSTALDIRKAKCNLFRDLLGRIVWNMSPEKRVVQQRWVLRKGPSQKVGNEAKVAGRPVWMSKECQTECRYTKKMYNVEAGTGDPREV